MDAYIHRTIRHISYTPRKSQVLKIAFALLAFGVWNSPGFAGTVTVNPGVNLQSEVNAYPSGTIFDLNPGVYRLQSVEPKNYDTFVAPNGGVYLNGSQHLTSFWQSGSYWVARVSVAWTSTTSTMCDSRHLMCDHPEDLFFDSVPRLRVVSLSEMGPGRWYLDYSTGDVYMGDNPSGHTVEMSLLPYAFSGSATGVKFERLVIEKYASPTNHGAIDGPASNQWVVEYCDLHHNHGLGVKIGNYMWVFHNLLHDNGQMGLGGTGKGASIQNNSIYYNNYAGYNYSNAGGSKFVSCFNLRVQSNNVFGNNGPGLWGDINNNYVLFEHNTTSNNRVAGIFYEVSYHATIRYNAISEDGYVPGQWSPWYGAGIMVSNSPYVDIYGNTVKDCMNGIIGRQTSRGTGPDGPYEIHSMAVHANVVTQASNFAEGIVKSSDFDNSIYSSWNNHFQDDTFALSDLSHPYFYWLDQDWTLAKWVEYNSLH